MFIKSVSRSVLGILHLFIFFFPFLSIFFFLVGGREWKENKINSEMVFRDFKANKEL